MPRPRTGQLKLRHGIWHARVTVDRDGERGREWYTLDTADHATAVRRLEKLQKELAAGRGPAAAAPAACAPDTVATYAAAIGARLSEGDRDNLRLYVLPVLGAMGLDEVRSVHVKSVRDKVIAAQKRGPQGKVIGTLRRGTVGKALGALRRLLAAAVEDEIIEHNPASDVRLPKQRGEDREIVKPRMILTDDEIAQYLACGEASFELRMLSVVARCEGGMRTGDLNAWDWTMIDVDGFTTCTIPRSKTAAPESLDVPEMLQPLLRAWWERAGCPTSGPVFPVRKGRNAGQAKARRGISYAERLRRDLLRAGVFRMQPVSVPARRQGMRAYFAHRERSFRAIVSARSAPS